MAKKLSVDLELNAQGYKQGINEAKGATAQYTNATRDLKKETEEYLEQFGNLRKDFNKARNEAKSLGAAFNQLSETEKKSELGKYMQEQLNIAIRKAAEFKDVSNDIDEAIRRAASDTLAWDAMKEGLEIGKDLATAYAGAVAKLTGNEKALKDIVATVAMVQGGANAAIKIGNALQKQSNIMIALGNVQLKAKAIAEELATKKTIAATAAQRVFNTVAKANPYVLLATVILGAATAIGTYVFATKKANDEDKKRKAVLESLNKAQESYTSTFSSTLGELMTKYKKLQIEWRNLTTEHQKNEWIKTNKNEFKELGTEVKNINDAERVFNQNSKFMIDNLINKAKATAKLAQATALYNEAATKQAEVDAIKADYLDKMANAKPQPGFRDPETGMSSPGKTREQVQAELMQEMQNKLIDKKLEAYELEQKAADILQESVNLNQSIYTATSNTTNESKKHQTQIEKMQAGIDKLKKQLESLPPDFVKTEKGQQAVKDLQEKISDTTTKLEEYKKAIGYIEGNIQIKFPDTSTLEARLKTGLKNLTDRLNAEAKKNPLMIQLKADFEEETNKAIREQFINNLKGKALNDGEIEGPDYSKILKIESLEEQGAALIKKRDEIISAVSTINQQYGNTEEGKAAIQELEEEYAKVIKQLDEMAAKADKINFKNDLGKNVKKGLSSLSDLNSSLSSIGNTWKSLDENWDDMSSFEKVTASFDAVVSTITQVIQAFEAITTVIQVFGAISSALSAKKTAENETEKQSEIGKLGAKQASSMANVTESGSKMPFPMNLVAIALGIAAVVAAFASIMGAFAEGGVVPGNSFTGDKLLARVNSGERILTAEQNKNVEKIANSVSGAGLNSGRVYVSGVIRGKDLLLVQKNYNTIGAKSGQSIKIG